MPDHMHGILYVTAPIDKHLGAVIARFKGKCTAALREDKPLSVYSATQSRTLPGTIGVARCKKMREGLHIAD